MPNSLANALPTSTELYPDQNCGAAKVPDMRIILWNNPTDSDENKWYDAQTEPEPYPQRVTLFGSPPKYEILSFNHWSTKCWSQRP